MERIYEKDGEKIRFSSLYEKDVAVDVDEIPWPILYGKNMAVDGYGCIYENSGLLQYRVLNIVIYKIRYGRISLDKICDLK